MKRFWVAIALAAGAPAVTLDRIAVTVGRQVIAESDVLRDVRVDAFLDRQPVDLSGAQKRKAAERLVDQALILQEASFSHITLPDRDEVAKLIDPVKAEYGADYAAALQRCGITEDDVIDHLLDGMRAMRYTDLRFRPEVQFSDDDLREEYSKLVEQWKQKGEPNIPGFEASRGDLEAILTNQRTAQALDRWLQNQRGETRIVYRDEVFR